MSAAAAITSPASPERTLPNAILAALSVPTQRGKERALRIVLQDWQGDDEAGVKSPHLLVHIFDDLHELENLPGALVEKDYANFSTFRTVCDELDFNLFFAHVDKVYGGVVFVDHEEIWEWEASRPKFELGQTNLFLDALMLERVVNIDREYLPGRIPVRDSEVLQQDPFTYETARIETCEGAKSMSSGMEYGLWHFHKKVGLVIIPPRNFLAYEVRQCFALPKRESLSWMDEDDEDIWDEYGPDKDEQQADTETVIQMLDKATANAQRPTADPTQIKKMQEMGELFFGYYERAEPNKAFQRGNASMFPFLHPEVLKHLTALCVEFSSQDIWRRSIKMIKTEPDLGAADLGSLLYQSLGKDNLEQPSFLVKGWFGIQAIIATCDKIRSVYEADQSQDGKLARLLKPKAFTTWRVSNIHKALAIGTIKDCITIIQAGQDLKDDKLVHQTLRQVSENVAPSSIVTCLQHMTKLKEDIPAADLQRYCETIVSANSREVDRLGLSELKAVHELLSSSLLPLPKTTIKNYCKQILKGDVEPAGLRVNQSAGEYIAPCVAIRRKLGKEGSKLLLPLLATFANDIPWLIKFLSKVKSSKPRTSDRFLRKLTATVLELAIDQLKPAARTSSSRLVRDTNQGSTTVTKEELKHFIQLLQDMGLDGVVDKLTDKMAQSDRFGVDRFRDVLGEEKTAEFMKKRKAAEEEESRNKKKARLALKDGKIVAAYD